jgi:N-acetylglucosamine-6-phosphate deacetylase
MAHGARLITHLFNAMPQLHHRDPSIIGLIGASPHSTLPFSPLLAPTPISRQPSALAKLVAGAKPTSEAFDDLDTPPQTPVFAASVRKYDADARFKTLDRPFYELIVDGIHSHPNSVRLAYNAHPEGCILITDGPYAHLTVQSD